MADDAARGTAMKGKTWCDGANSALGPGRSRRRLRDVPFSSPPLLVVTPTLGRSPWLPQTVASVASLKLRCIHLLVAPPDVVSDLAAQFPQVRVIAEPGGGMYAAINAGLTAAGGWSGFTYLNDDDLLLPRFAAAAGRAETAGDRPAIFYGGVRLIDAQGQRLGAIPISPLPSLNRALYAQRLEPVYQHGTLVTRAAWTELGGFDASLRFCGDSEFLARACVKGVPFVRLGGGPVAAFRLRTGQLTKNRAAMETERARVDRQWNLLAPRRLARHHWARWVFRAANLPIYAERIARHGFVSFDELLARAG